MSRNAFPQLEREYAEDLAYREHIRWEREQVLTWEGRYPKETEPLGEEDGKNG